MAEVSVSGSPGAPRLKREQVVRACDSCRQHRIKCDSCIPCSNCKTRGGKCSNIAVKSTTLPHAYREIERLRRKVQELERELQQERNRAASGLGRRLPPSTTLNPPELSSSDVIDSHYGNPHSFWEGIRIRTSRSANETWYGASSLFYFIGRISSFLSSTFQQTHSADQMLDLNPAATLLDSPINTVGRQSAHQTKEEELILAAEECYLSPMQEEYFLDLYWHSYHTSLFPILNEADFKEYYRSLWAACDTVRKPSSLADIVVAMSMQYGISMLPATRQQLSVDNYNDATVAGRWYYLRCQRLLAYELECPTISTLQCQLLCAVYLCCGTFQNMADSACSTAVRTAYMLGLHLDPPDNMPEQEREMRKRLWWALYVFESKFGMKLGRPFLLHLSNVSPGLPDHHLQAAMQSGSNFAPLGDNLTWLTFNLEHTKLFLTARAAYTAFYGKDLNLCNGQRMWNDLPALETHAGFLGSYMKKLEEWANAVPSALQTKRKTNARPFSTNVSDLDIEQFAPLWLQRQRLLLELMYHNLCTNLYRPFISFGPMPMSTLAEQNAINCAHHAMALTRITQQVLSSTSILAGWHEAFQWQWNAAMTLVGFVLAYPRGTSTATAREAIDLSVDVFDTFGNSFAVATSAASIVRKLSSKISFLIQRGAEKQAAVEINTRAGTVEPAASLGLEPLTSNGSTIATPVEYGLGFDEMTTAQLQDVFNIAFDVDQWTDLNMLWPSTCESPLDG
ncbi:hypothetical protein V502_00031 [Pseudogymnoascus sp. VKM F-4520 (FW-2644)]|nr:hypothetical protein V502_00031 [Pseudogymnoascus sp. VKM F-4520 (FW-2644)]